MYYPLSEITENLYTAGSEFVDNQTKEYYVGYYFSTSDGKYFTGKTLNVDAREIVRFPGIDQSINVYSPTNFVPFPTESDYEAGNFTRYVIKRVNSGFETIKEVSKQDYEKSLIEPVYIQVSFSWKITGPLYDDFSNPLYPIQGVLTTNQQTVVNLEPKLPEISFFFKNYAEFYK